LKNIETPEISEETNRQHSSLRVSYQRESDIPKVPYDNFNYSYADAVYIPSQKVIQPPKLEIPIQPSMMMPIPTIPGIMPGNLMDPNYMNMMMMSQPPTIPMYFPKMLLNNNNTKPINYRTEACKNFHSAAGCTHGDACHFIHDFTYEGRPIPNMAEWRRSNSIRMKNIEAMKSAQMGMPSYYPPASEPHLR
jgi:Zinc finger C-x8-C-x5-C-x3-H type (and similar)